MFIYRYTVRGHTQTRLAHSWAEAQREAALIRTLHGCRVELLPA